MIRLMVLGVVGMTVAGCATQSAYEPPVVDMRGVDPQKYANDLADCTKAKQDMGWFTRGAPISDCLTERGYHVTIAKS
jgi:hypothetical protein